MKVHELISLLEAEDRDDLVVMCEDYGEKFTHVGEITTEALTEDSSICERCFRGDEDKKCIVLWPV